MVFEFHLGLAVRQSISSRISAAAMSTRSLPLSVGLAVLSYAPFPVIAKISLVVIAVLFVGDPYPPVSRLIALVSLLVVAYLSRLHQEMQQQEQEVELKEEEKKND